MEYAIAGSSPSAESSLVEEKCFYAHPDTCVRGVRLGPAVGPGRRGLQAGFYSLKPLVAFMFNTARYFRLETQCFGVLWFFWMTGSQVLSTRAMAFLERLNFVAIILSMRSLCVIAAFHLFVASVLECDLLSIARSPRRAQMRWEVSDTTIRTSAKRSKPVHAQPGWSRAPWAHRSSMLLRSWSNIGG
jgi:hypothetical protein